MTPTEEISAPKTDPRRKMHWLAKLMILLFCIIILSIALIQVPFVQGLIVNRITNNLSKILKTEVSIDKVQLNIFRGLELKGLFIADVSGNPLLEGATVSSTFRDNLLSLINKKLFIKNLHVKELSLNILRLENEEKSNLGVLIDNYNASKSNDLSGGKNQDEVDITKPFLMEVQNISLENVKITQIDNVRGQIISYSLGKGKILIEHLNLKDKIIELKELVVNDPIVKVSIFKGSYLTNIEGFSSQEEVIDELKLGSKKDSFSVFCAKAQINRGQFILDNSRSTAKDSLLGGIDYNHLQLQDISIQGDSLLFNESNIFQLANPNCSLATNDGFKITDFSGDQLLFSRRKIELTNALIKTEKSIIKDHLSFKFRSIQDLGEFVDKVILDLKIKQSSLSILDLVYLVPILENNEFFNKKQK